MKTLVASDFKPVLKTDLKPINFELLNRIDMFLDTEFFQGEFYQTLLYSFTSNLLNENEIAVVSDEFENLDVIKILFETLNYSIQQVETDNLIEKIDFLENRSFQILNGDFPKNWKDLILKDELIQTCLTFFETNCFKPVLKVKKNNVGERYITVELEPDFKIELNLIFHFQTADLFKIVGSHSDLFLTENIVNFKTIRFKKSPSIYYKINNFLIEFEIKIQDTFYRSVGKSLKIAANLHNCEYNKIELETDSIAVLTGLKKEEIMSNFDKVLKNIPELAIKYSAMDVLVTAKLYKNQNIFFDKICDYFNFNKFELSDTLGTNVTQMFLKFIKKYLNITKENEKILDGKIKESTISELQNHPFNDYGFQIFLTVGGLLFSRCSKFPEITGLLSDCDQSSCYATAMSDLNLYFGTPLISTRLYNNQKYKLKDLIVKLNKMQLPDDSWFCRVSGNFNKVVNTLIMSDLRFKPENLKLKTIEDLNPEKNILARFDVFKTSKTQATSVLLTKEIKFGVVTADLLKVIFLYPDDWIKEFLDLTVDVFVHFPKELMCDSIKELEDIESTLSDEFYDQIENKDNVNLESRIGKYSKKNCCLKIPIGNFISELREKRKELKKIGDPVQEIYKLLSNSGYGILASIYLKLNNGLASNIITARARSATHLMTNFLNGFNPITDGTAFGWNYIPLDKTFKEILKSNPNYLIEFDPKIKNNLTRKQVETICENFNPWFKAQMAKFYDYKDDFKPGNRFDYELKLETCEGKKTVFFNHFYSSGSGNYVKGFSTKNSIFYDESDYELNSIDLEDEYIILNDLKARGYRQDSELNSKFINAIKNFEKPIIVEDFEILKFTKSNQFLIRLLTSTEYSNQRFLHPMGLSVKTIKMMKLIGRSQFVFQTEKQLKNFETNQLKFNEISKKLCSKNFWETLKNDDIKNYNVKMFDNFDYYEFSKNHSVGPGFEILTKLKKYGTVQKIREKIQNSINEGTLNFNEKFRFDRDLTKFDDLKFLIASIIIKKANNELNLIKTMVESIENNPASLKVDSTHISKLKHISSSFD